MQALPQVYALKSGDQSWKTIYVSNEEIALTEKSVKDPMEFFAHTSKWHVLREIIPIESITTLQYGEKEGRQLVIVREGGKTRMKFAHRHDLLQAIEHIAGIRGSQQIDRKPNIYKVIEWPLIFLLLLSPWVYVFYQKAAGIASGSLSLSSDQGKAGKDVLNITAARLGTQNVVLITAVLVAACGYLVYRRLRRPPMDIVETLAPLQQDWWRLSANEDNEERE